MVHGILSLTFDSLVMQSRVIPEASFKCTDTCSQPRWEACSVCLGAPTPLAAPGHMPEAFPASGQLNTTSRHAEHHLPCKDGQNFMCLFFFQKIFFYVFKKPLNLIICICSSSGAFFVCLFSLKLVSLPCFDMALNQLKPLITW